MKKLLPRLLFGLLCIGWILGHAHGYWRVSLINLLENYFYDVRVRTFMPQVLDERIVIIDIDEKSLAELGRWPWNRSILSELVRKLSDEYAASVIGFDIVFAEADNSSGLPVLEGLAQDELRGNAAFRSVLEAQRNRLDYDKQFAEALRGRPVVLGFYFSNRSGATAEAALPQPEKFSLKPFPGQFPDWQGFGGNLAIFQQAAVSGGQFNPLMDEDGITRRVPLLASYQGNFYPALSLAILQLWADGAVLEPYAPSVGAPVEWLDVLGKHQKFRIPVDMDGAALVPYRGYEGSFHYVSAADVIAGRADMDILFGKIVLVGTTAPGLKDLRATPVGGSYPGVEVHANVLAGILDDSIKERPPYMDAVEILLLIIVGGGFAVLLPFLSPLWGAVCAVSLLGLLVAANLLLWQMGVVMPFASVAFSLILTYGFNTAWGFFWESRVKRQFTELFGQYVPPELVDEMARNPESYSMEGRNAEMTVLFSDVRNFTTISEGLDPKELSAMMNEYLGAMTAIIQRYRGTLDKYIGDAIMAFWGAPISDSEHARKAVLVALEMQTTVAALASIFRDRGWPVLQIGVGVNSGVMTVGDMGSAVRKSYTVMGDAVNLGARLEGITKEYGVGIAVGEETRRLCPGIVFRELDKVRVKGKAGAVSIYEPIGEKETVGSDVQDEVDDWHQALAYYRACQWDEAEVLLKSLHEQKPSMYLYQLYIDRIQHLRINPPNELAWDGVTTFKTK